MIDDDTMRIVLAGMSLTVFVLFYFGVYGPTRSSFSGWWTLSLLLVGVWTSLLTFDDGNMQVVTNPVSNMVAALGVTCIWFAMRSLRSKPLPRWLLAVAPVAVMVPRALEDPTGNLTPDNGALFLYMAVMLVAATVEAWRAWVARRALASPALDGKAAVGILVIALAGSVVSAFYVMRTAMHLAVGPDSESFRTTAGSGPESAIVLVCLVAITFSVSAVGWDQRTQELRRRAMHDDLTGLLGRTEFRLQAESAFARARISGTEALLVVADLDHFKAINDVHGHAAGDRALLEFSSVLKESLRPGELAGRLGGEEFGIVLLDVDESGPHARLTAISDAFAARSSNVDFALPSVSYGIAGVNTGGSVAEIYEHADLALYRAKADGRNRSVTYSSGLGRRSGRVRTGLASDRGAAVASHELEHGVRPDADTYDVV
ncbi:GGDEF domain-containing protein [Demequina sp. SO4-13]|uniref:GGDEF domain-containing protein n=1 Tax=Demequina sp. SO4-13 TaxID=3401027 RepID=UPI003AF4B113